jgi:hypothetical protein
MNKFSSNLGSQLTKTASGYKFSITKEEWLTLGKKAGWIKEAYSNLKYIEFDTGSEILEVGYTYSGIGEDLDIEILSASVYNENNEKVDAEDILHNILSERNQRTRLYEKIQDDISSNSESARENTSFGKNKGKYDL